MARCRIGKIELRPDDGSIWRFASEAARSELAGHLDAFAVGDNRQVASDADIPESDSGIVKHNGSRTVQRCEIESLGVFYLKYFHRPPFLRRLWEALTGGDAERELAVSKRLLTHGVATQEILATGRLNGDSWIVSREIPNSRLLSELREDFVPDIWSSPHRLASLSEKRAWIKAVAELLAGMHNAGVLHLDLHSGNIMLDGEKAAAGRLEPIICDLHRMRIHAAGHAPRSGCARDLARLDHDCGRFMSRSDRLRFLVHYLRRRPVIGTLRGWVMIIDHLRELHQSAFLRSRSRRIGGNNRYFGRLTSSSVSSGGPVRGHVLLRSKSRSRLWAATEMVFDRQHWQQMLSDGVDQLLSPGKRKFQPRHIVDSLSGVSNVVKDSPSALVVRKAISVGDCSVDVYVKYARVKHKWKCILDILRGSRSLRAFRSSHELILCGVPVALPLACAQYSHFGLPAGSVLITESFEGGVSARKFLEHQSRQPHDGLKRAMLCRAARVIRKMHDSGYTHRDLKASNVLARAAKAGPGGVDVILIDMDGLGRQPMLGLHGRLKNLARFLASLNGARAFKVVEDTNYFLECYLRTYGQPGVDVSLCRALIEDMIEKRT